MRQLLIPGLIWFSAIGCGLIAGTLLRLFDLHHDGTWPHRTGGGHRGHECDQCGDREVAVHATFPGDDAGERDPGSYRVLPLGRARRIAMLAGGVIYVLGMFIVTIVFNVPLNDALAAAQPSSTGAASLWTGYLKDWTIWNHVRTIASAAACALFIVAIATR